MLGLCILRMIGLIVHQNYICILMLMTIYECKFLLYIHIVTYIFIIEKLHVLLDFTKKLIYRIFVLQYVAMVRGSWFLIKRCTPSV
jgi:hypothetical protein